jgi:hypothetical protein
VRRRTAYIVLSAAYWWIAPIVTIRLVPNHLIWFSFVGLVGAYGIASAALARFLIDRRPISKSQPKRSIEELQARDGGLVLGLSVFPAVLILPAANFAIAHPHYYTGGNPDYKIILAYTFSIFFCYNICLLVLKLGAKKIQVD